MLDLAAAEIGQAHPAQRWAARRLYALVALLMYTGVRKTEALTLRVADVRLPERIINLTARVGGQLKTDAAAQPIPIPEPLAAILRGWVGHLDRSDYLFPCRTLRSPWTGGPMGHTAGGQLKLLGMRAGVPDLTFQSLRHAFATHAEYWGLTELQLQRILRHTNNQYQDPEVLPPRPARELEGHGPRGPLRDGGRAAGRHSFRSPPADRRRRPCPRATAESGRGRAVGRGRRRRPDGRLPPDPGVPAAPGRLGPIRLDEHPPRLGPWRLVRQLTPRGGPPVVNLRRDGRTVQRTVASIMREVFGEDPAGPPAT